MHQLRHRILFSALLAISVLAETAACTSGQAPSTSPLSGHASPPSGAAASPAGSQAPETNPPGDIPDSQVFVRYTPSRAPFSMVVPEGWARHRSGAADVFASHYNSVRIEFHATAGQPSVASVRTRELPAVRASTSAYRAGAVRAIRRQPGTVILATYRARSERDPVTDASVPTDVERYCYFHAGTEVVVTLSGAVGADNVDPWRRISDSVRWA